MKGNYTDNISAPSHLAITCCISWNQVSSCSTLSVNRSWPWTDWCSLPHAKRILNTTVSLHPQIHFLESQLFCYRVFFLRGSKLQLYLLLGLGACFGSWEKQCWIYLLYISSYLPPYFCFQNKMNTCFTWNCWWLVKQWFLFPCYIFMYSTPTNICWAKHRCHITDFQIRIIQSCHSAQVFVSTWPVWTLFTSYDRVSCGCKLLRFFELFWLHSGTALMWFQ